MIWGLLLSASAYNPLTTCNGTPTHWGQQPSVWRLSDQGNASVYSGISNGDLTAANEAGWEVWSIASSGGECSGWASANGGLSSAPFNLNDAVNVVAFTESTWDAALGDPNSTIAVTAPVFFESNCEIVTADQLYNAVNFVFTLGTAGTDVQSIMAHENGHWLGLGHSGDGSATMFPSYTGGTSFRTLSADDEAGVVDLYPEACAPSETACGDGLDNDNDGRIDCADADCAAVPSCACVALEELACNTAVEGTTVGAANTVQSWGCADWETTGPEAVFTFTPRADGPVTVTAAELEADLDLFVGEADGDACDPDACTASGNPDASAESVTLEGRAGVSYAVTLDGWEGAESSFTLTIECTEPVEPPDTDTDTPVDSDPGPVGAAGPNEPVGGCACRTSAAGDWTMGSLVLFFFLRRTGVPEDL